MSMVLGKVTRPVLGAHASLPVLGQAADMHPVVGEVFLVLGALAQIPLDTECLVTLGLLRIILDLGPSNSRPLRVIDTLCCKAWGAFAPVTAAKF